MNLPDLEEPQALGMSHEPRRCVTWQQYFFRQAVLFEDLNNLNRW